MTAQPIDGKRIAAEIREEIREEVRRRAAQGLRPPGLAVVLVGENPASQFYVRSKSKACQEAGFHSVQVDRPSTIAQEELLAIVADLNARPEIDGILVQLPLPKHMDEERVLLAIDPAKDVDGFHPINVGNLSVGRPGFVPCTPLGVRELLVREGIETRGRFAVVVGRSNIVGKPMAQLLMARGKGGDATVCVCHSATPNLAEVVRRADILVAAIGKAEAISGDMIKPGAVVVDVGINRVDDASEPKGYRVCGDVHYESAARVASRITPVPGGVGPMTIAMLLKNTLDSCARREGTA